MFLCTITSILSIIVLILRLFCKHIYRERAHTQPFVFQVKPSDSWFLRQQSVTATTAEHGLRKLSSCVNERTEPKTHLLDVLMDLRNIDPYLLECLTECYARFRRLIILLIRYNVKKSFMSLLECYLRTLRKLPHILTYYFTSLFPTKISIKFFTFGNAALLECRLRTLRKMM